MNDKIMKQQLKSKVSSLAIGGFCSLCALISMTGCQTINEAKEASTQNGVVLSEIKHDQEQLLPAITSLRSDLAEQNATKDKALTMCLDSLNKTTEQNTALAAALNTCHDDSLAVKNRIAQPVAAPKATETDPLKLPDGKMIFGEAEWIYIAEAEVSFDSRIDSGASVSSINAVNVQKFERDGRKWYSFDIPVNTSHLLHLEAPLVRMTDIKKASGNGDTENRPVVKLTVKIGGYTGQAEFSLKDRTTMQYPVLIGREFIKDIAVVDVSRIHVQPKIKDTNTVGSLKLKRDGTKIPNSQEVKMNKKEREESIPARLKTDDESESVASKKAATNTNSSAATPKDDAAKVKATPKAAPAKTAPAKVAPTKEVASTKDNATTKAVDAAKAQASQASADATKAPKAQEGKK